MSAAEKRGLGTWKKSRLFRPVGESVISKSVVDARRAPTSKMVDGEKSEKGRLVAQGDQGPNLKDGVVETFGCVSPRSSRL